MLSESRTDFIKLFGFISIWVIYVVVAATYGYFSFSHKINILYPFMAIMGLGIIFTFIYSIIGLKATWDDKEAPAFWLEVILFIIATAGLVVSVLALPALNYDAQLLPENYFVASSCVLGIIMGGVGLSVLSYHALRNADI